MIVIVCLFKLAVKLKQSFCHSTTNNGFVEVTYKYERFHKCCQTSVCGSVTRGVVWIRDIIITFFFYIFCCFCYWMCESDDCGR